MPIQKLVQFEGLMLKTQNVLQHLKEQDLSVAKDGKNDIVFLRFKVKR